MTLSLLCTFIGAISDEQEAWRLLHMALATHSSTAHEPFRSAYRLDLIRAVIVMADGHAASRVVELQEIAFTATVRCSFQPLTDQEDSAIIQFQFKNSTDSASSRLQSIVSTLELEQVVVDSLSTTTSASIMFRTIEDARHALFRVVDMTAEYSIAQVNIIKASTLHSVPFVVKANSTIPVGIKQSLREAFSAYNVSVIDVYHPWAAAGGDQVAYLWCISEQGTIKVANHEPIALSAAGVLALFDADSVRRLLDNRIRVDFLW